MQIGAARRWGFGKGHWGTVSKFIQGFEVHWEISHKISNWDPKVIMYWYVLICIAGICVLGFISWNLIHLIPSWDAQDPKQHVWIFFWDTKKKTDVGWVGCGLNVCTVCTCILFVGVDWCRLYLIHLDHTGEYDVLRRIWCIIYIYTYIYICIAIHQSSPIVDYM